MEFRRVLFRSYNVTHDIPLSINKDALAIDFVYVDDIIKEFVDVISGKRITNLDINHVEPHYSEKLDDIANLLYSFKESRQNLLVPLQQDGFAKKLYSTYLSYLDDADFAYPLV